MRVLNSDDDLLLEVIGWCNEFENLLMSTLVGVLYVIIMAFTMMLLCGQTVKVL